jgi:competence protein ComFC
MVSSRFHFFLPTPISRRRSLFRELLDGCLAVAFPTHCALCGNDVASDGAHRICRLCWESFQPWTGPLCSRCGLPFVSVHALDSSVGQCSACRADLPGFDAARAFGLYSGKLRQVILRLKFAGDLRLGLRLGQLLVHTWDCLLKASDRGSALIVPVPLHPSRRRERGYNQSEVLAGGLLRALRSRTTPPAPQFAATFLRRIRPTPPQTGLRVTARRENLRGAFEVVRPNGVQGRNIVLVDDVMTTGTTLSSCAKALKHSGAGLVLGLTLARATPQFPDFGREEADNVVDGLGGDST